MASTKTDARVTTINEMLLAIRADAAAPTVSWAPPTCTCDHASCAVSYTPPAGMEVGYVPVPIYQRVRAKPPNCDVVLVSRTIVAAVWVALFQECQQ